METSAHNEISLCLFACYMTNIGLQTSTVCTYTSLVRTGLQREYGFPLTLSGWEFRLPRLLKGMKKQFARIRKKRLGFRAKHQRLLHDYFRSRGTEHTPKVLLIHALFATGRQCLARSIEMCPNKAADMDPAKHMTCLGRRPGKCRRQPTSIRGWHRIHSSVAISSEERDQRKRKSAGTSAKRRRHCRRFLLS